jgi:hypothetical protein
MVLHGKPCGRVGRCRDYLERACVKAGSFFCPQSDVPSTVARATILLVRVRLRRRVLVAFGVSAAAAVLVALAFGPLVRSKVAASAARRHLDVNVGAVRAGWFAVRLLDCSVRPHGLSSIHAHVDEVRVGLGLRLGVKRIDLRGAEVALTGSPEVIRDEWRTWHEAQAEATVRSGPSTPIEASGVSLRWVDPESGGVGAELLGITGSRVSREAKIALMEGHARFGRAAIDLSDAAAELDAQGMLVRAHANALAIGWDASVDQVRPPDAPASEPIAPTAAPAATAHSTRTARRPHPPPPSSADAGAPLLSLPDLRSARARASAIVSLLTERIQQSADLGVDALTWKITQDPRRMALTIGPGPVSFVRTESSLELRYSSAGHVASTPLALRILLPTDGSDVVMTVDGGPIAIPLLGVKEGGGGLVDVDRTSVAGRVRVVLAGDGGSLIFDADAAANGLSLSHPSLALDVVRGLDVALRARGAISASGQMRLDDFAVTLGALHLAGSGVLDQTPDHVVAAARFDVPSTACQSLLDSIPAALLPTLQGSAMTGTFGAHGSFAFDTRSLDSLELNYEVNDRCRLIHVPPALAPDRFTEPFVHRIYLPDGTTAEQMSGPGTSNWTSLEHVSPYMQIAVLTTEDGAFPKHHGYNHAAIRASIISNLKARRFARGASTITMQLAKNLFLSRDKTLSRKLEEVVLTDYLEQTFAKDEILELYLNVIEFGPAVYGIASAAEYYFGRTPAELDLAECLFLSTLLPAPLRYAGMREGEQPPDGWMRTIHMLMEVAHRRGLLTDAELAEGESEPIVFWHGGPRPPPRAAIHARPPAAGQDSDIPDPFENVPDAP